MRQETMIGAEEVRRRIRGGDRLLNQEQARALMGGISRSHFYNLVNCGTLPAHRLGERYGLVVWESDVCRFIASRQDA